MALQAANLASLQHQGSRRSLETESFGGLTGVMVELSIVRTKGKTPQYRGGA